jgi:hypothetical protein
MKLVRYCRIALLAVVPALFTACSKPAQVTVLKSPPGGFKNEKAIERYDDAGGIITVDMAIGDNAIVVSSSTPPTSDVAMAWISNTAPKMEKVYKFKSNSIAEYYLYATTSGGWRIEEVKKNGQTNPTWMQGTWTVCDTHPNNGPDVGFKTCTSIPAGAQVKHSSMTGGSWKPRFIAS